MFADLQCFPLCVVKMMLGGPIRQMLKPKYFTQNFIQSAIHYQSMMLKNIGKQDCVLGKMILFPGFLHNHLFTEQKMLQDFDFPIGFVYGTRDFFGSAEGAHRIVQNNRHFSSGRSQIFKLRNSGHNVFFDSPDVLTEQMIGFFEGTITGTFDLKPRKEFVKDVPEDCKKGCCP